MGFIYYIYESNKKSGHQAYIGKTTEESIDVRLSQHIRATFHKGVDPISGFNSNPAINIFPKKGISNCIFGYFSDSDNSYGIGQDTVDAFKNSGWKIYDLLGFAEICHILVQRGPEALSNINEGGSTGAIAYDFTANQKIQTFLEQYNIIKKLQSVGYRPWTRAHPIDRLLHPIKYGGTKIIKDLLTRILVNDTETWVSIIKTALAGNLSNCEQIIKEATKTVISDFNNAFQDEMTVSLNVNQLAKEISKWIEERIQMPSIKTIVDSTVQILQIALGNVHLTAAASKKGTKFYSATTKDIKGTTKASATNKETFNLMLDNALTFNCSQQDPIWLQCARRNIRVPSRNTLTDSYLQDIIKQQCADEFAKIIIQEIETPQTSSDVEHHKLLFNAETVFGYRGEDAYRDTLSNKVKEHYLAIFGSNTPVIRFWAAFFREQYEFWRNRTNRRKIRELRTDRDRLIVSSAELSQNPFIYYRKRQIFTAVLNQPDIGSCSGLTWNYL